MSLVTIDNDSSDAISIISIPDDNDEEQSSEARSENKSGTTTEKYIDENSSEVSSPSRSQDSNVLSPEVTDNSTTISVNTNSNTEEERPILDLMKHLINYEGKQNTMLTNAELMKILKKELHIDVLNLPQISLDIYVNILKKFLKEWPQWDEFDRVMHEARCMNDTEQLEKVLETKYTALRKYLAAILKASKPFVSQSARKIKRYEDLHQVAQVDPEPQFNNGHGDVILEVNCTRSQLNTLFFSKPNPNFNNSIFNVPNSLPSKINISAPSLKAILNSSNVRISINTKCFKYKREIVHELKHKLVNKKNPQPVQDHKLSEYLQTPKSLPKTHKIVSKKDIKRITKEIIRSRCFNQDPVKTIFQIIKEDVSVIKDVFSIPVVFRHFMNPYAYVRYLHEDVDTESDKYDLHLEEIISPRLKFQVTQLCFESIAECSTPTWLKLKCMFCELNFVGITGVEELAEHIRDNHQDEPDLICTNCYKKFSFNELALTRWYHNCESPVVLNSDTE